jgi:phosphoserine phosphatase
VTPRFATVVLDVDSTVSGMEGIDWLASLREPDVARRIAEMTADAMAGRRKLGDVYAARLDMVRPTRAEVEHLAEAYIAAVAPGAAEVVRHLIVAGVRVLLVTGGMREAVLPLAANLGVPEHDVHAVPLEYDPDGAYVRFDPDALTAAEQGKRLLMERLAPTPPVLAVGDGITDAELKPAVDAFAAYVGFVRREETVERADFVLESFADLEDLVLSAAVPARLLSAAVRDSSPSRERSR